ncbi:hypothetical protein [Sulfuricurvum sp.]|uniref:hypothetical protein n=1 Tax=Sulfuricurvum sp. TaxID=2025608 RepID=UPI002602D4B6|nr:hypothetical protein [Sulfuricurvum sp.]MDD2781961.1 hypothetical protein [Sulfuricurvum sp.]
MNSIKIVTVNQDEKYNTIDVLCSENGTIEELYDSDIANSLSEGESDYEDTSDMTEVDLGDGSEYGKVFISITEDDPRFQEIEQYIQGAGSYLHEMDPELQDSYDDDED